MENFSSKIIKLFSLLFILNINLFAQVDWVTITPTEYSAIYFDSPSVGWVASNDNLIMGGVIRKTMDGGKSWRTVLSDPSVSINKIEFGYGGGEGYAVGSKTTGSVTFPTLFYSSDGGNNWMSINLPEYRIADVSIDYDAQQGYQTWVATRESILYCKSFSNNFVERKNGIDENHFPLYVKFIEDQIGWTTTTGWDAASSSQKNYLYHTTDGGLNWTLIQTFDYIVNNMKFYLGGVGIVTGIAQDQSKYIYRTANYGYTWDEIVLPEMENYSINDIVKEEGSTRIWITGQFNFGNNQYFSLLFNESPFYDMWQPDSSFMSQNNYIKLNKICMPTSTDGRKLYIAGDDIYKTNRIDYSSNWNSSQFTIKGYSLNDLYFFDSNNGFSVGNHKGILKTTDAGDNWTPITSDETSETKLLKIYFLDEYKGWACGTHGSIMLTTDAGETWTEINSGTITTLHDIYFLNENRGIAVGGFESFENGGVYDPRQSILISDDGGFSWQVKELNSSDDTFYDDRLTSIYFIDELEGWLGGAATILHTTNAGDTWEGLYDTALPYTTGPYNIQSIHFTDKYYGVAAGGGLPEMIWWTTDGGATWLDVAWNTWPSSHGGYEISDIDFKGGKYWAVGSNQTYIGNYWGSSWHGDFQKGYWSSPSSLFMIDENTAFISGGRAFARRQSPILTSINEKEKLSDLLPKNFALSQNYPNPFNPTTEIQFQIAKAGNVTIKVYDVLGDEISTLVQEYKQPGKYKTKFQGSGLASGVYFYTLKTENDLFTRKMLLLK